MILLIEGFTSELFFNLYKINVPFIDLLIKIKIIDYFNLNHI